MTVDISLADELPSSWRTQIQRQIDFKLASVSSSVRMLRISLTILATPSNDPIHSCHMSAQLQDGTIEEVTATGLANVCIADSAARLARSIGRKAKHKEARWNRSPRV